MDIATAARIAGGWLAMDLDDAQQAAEPVTDGAVYVCTQDGRAALVDRTGGVLLARPTLPFPAHLKDFHAGWRSDYVARRTP